MKLIITIISLLLLFPTSMFAQTFDNDVKKIVNQIVDMSLMYGIRDLILLEKDKEVKESFLKDFDQSLEVFYKVYIDFYSSKYTHDEIKQMLAFYETPAGKKFANDLLLLSSNSFPKGKEWSKKLDEIKKKLKK